VPVTITPPTSQEQYYMLKMRGTKCKAKRRTPSQLIDPMKKDEILCVRVKPIAGSPYECRFFRKNDGDKKTLATLLADTPDFLLAADMWIIDDELHQELAAA
jgi:hypothetical protein